MKKEADLLLFAEKTTPRLEWAADLFFKNLSGLDVFLTSDRAVFEASVLPKINYSTRQKAENKAAQFWLPPHAILFENEILDQKIDLAERNGLPVFFQNSEAGADWPFDPLAASFFLVSRFEEYLPFKKDAHGRFAATESLAFRAGFLQKPLVNFWALAFFEALKKRFPSLVFRPRKFEFELTFDIDYAFETLEKGFFRTVGGLFRHFLKGQFSEVKRKTAVLAGLEKDAFDTFGYQNSVVKKFGLAPPTYFFHLGDYTGEPDAPIDFRRKKMRALIKNLAQKSPIGIHPSYRASKNHGLVAVEKGRLEAILGQKVSKSRQHFLRLEFPATYRTLLENGISEDFTMGYADEIGFRASIAAPFFWFDLEKNEATRLVVRPFAAMDATMRFYQKDSKKAIADCFHAIEEARSVGGLFGLLWHNSSLSDRDEWAGWRTVFERILEHGRV